MFIQSGIVKLLRYSDRIYANTRSFPIMTRFKREHDLQNSLRLLVLHKISIIQRDCKQMIRGNMIRQFNFTNKLDSCSNFPCTHWFTVGWNVNLNIFDVPYRTLKALLSSYFTFSHDVWRYSTPCSSVRYSLPLGTKFFDLISILSFLPHAIRIPSKTSDC